jgi:acetyltransferase-like isoleucine patch superfamily enzyme
VILDSAGHYVDFSQRRERPPAKPVVIEESVWLASRVMVLPGVTIGRNSQIAAGSVVTSDIPADSLAAGVPARVLTV